MESRWDGKYIVQCARSREEKVGCSGVVRIATEECVLRVKNLNWRRSGWGFRHHENDEPKAEPSE